MSDVIDTLAKRITSGVKFLPVPWESINEAGEKSDKRLGYRRITGRGSSCKWRVLSGKIEVLSSQLGLTKEKKTDDWIFRSVSAAVSYLDIEVDDLGALERYQLQILPRRINPIECISKNGERVILRLPPDSVFPATLSQHVEVFGGDRVRRGA